MMTTMLPQSPLIRHFYRVPQSTQVQSLVQSICYVTLPGYELIENVHQYKEFYNRRIALENSDFEHQPRLSDYGVYDVDCMSDPEVDEKNLTFFVKDTHQNPHKVEVDLATEHVTCGPLPTIY